MQKIKVGIFFGGQSREREVSFAGGRTVYDSLNKELFEAIPIFVDSFGNFCLLHWEHVYKGSIRDFYPPTFLRRETQRINCLPELPHGFQVYAESLANLENNKIAQHNLLKEIGNPIEAHEFSSCFDFAFLALHGTYGEDGSIQGLLEWYGIPYSGSGILPSALGINKAIQKDFQTTAGLFVNEFNTIDKQSWFAATENERKSLFVQFNIEFGEKFVIKPAHQGSSLGVTLLRQPDFHTFCDAINLAFFHLSLHQKNWCELEDESKIIFIKQLTDLRSGLGLPLIADGQIFHLPDALLDYIENQFQTNERIELQSMDSESIVLIESLIEGKEFSCIVVADEAGIPFALPPTEIRKNSELFDYRSKYLPGLSNKVTPIEVTAELIEDIRLACCQLYGHFGFEVYARIDGFIDENGEIFLNDPNTTSGMMPSSFFFHQAAEIGLSPSAFLTLIYFNSLRARIQSHPKGQKFESLLQRSQELLDNSHGSSAIKKKIAVVMGGYSFERHISMESGRNIYEKLSSSEEFEPIPLFLTGDNQSYRLFHLPINMMLKDNADDIRDKILHYSANPVLMEIQEASRALTKSVLRTLPTFKPTEVPIAELPNLCEGVFIALHGRPGEDGTIQADLSRLGLYFNGSESEASSVTINKYETNKKLRDLGFLVAEHQLVNRSEWQLRGFDLCTAISLKYGLPLIAKPADDGCSAAVRKIKSTEELHLFMEAIFREDFTLSAALCAALNVKSNDEIPQKSDLLVEQFIDRAGATKFLEVTGGMLTSYDINGQLLYEIFEPSESLAESEILSLEEKFLAGQGQNITPSRFSNNPKEQSRISTEVRNTLKKVAIALNVTGYCRIDAFVRIFENGKIETIIIEVNSLPGMTPATCIYHQAAIKGYKPFEFIREILKFGENRMA